MAKKNEHSYEDMINFIEDLCWLLDSKKDMNYADIPRMLRRMSKGNEKTAIELQKEDLVGILPQVLTDTDLFRSNKSLAQFSNEILNIQILNWEKRSRNEMIRVIICRVQDNEEIRKGISSYLLSNILKNKNEFAEIQKKSEKEHNNFSWNDAIHDIVKYNYE